jgi:hypothetical protein
MKLKRIIETILLVLGTILDAFLTNGTLYFFRSPGVLGGCGTGQINNYLSCGFPIKAETYFVQYGGKFPQYSLSQTNYFLIIVNFTLVFLVYSALIFTTVYFLIKLSGQFIKDDIPTLNISHPIHMK